MGADDVLELLDNQVVVAGDLVDFFILKLFIVIKLVSVFKVSIIDFANEANVEIFKNWLRKPYVSQAP